MTEGGAERAESTYESRPSTGPRGLLRNPTLRRALLLCIPALIAGAWVRVDLLSRVPEAWFNTDIRQVVSLAEHFLEEGEIQVPWRRTFLPALQLSVPMFFGASALRFAAITQHLLGLAFIVVAGLATVAWTRHWRWWIVPVTLVAALHPVFLWFEHLALPDMIQATFVLATSVAGWAFFRRPSPTRFGLLLAAIFLAAGARQEGRYFCAFALAAVVFVQWRQPRRLAAYLAVALVFSFLTFRWTETTQSGQMLLASTIHLMPDELRGYPGLSEQLVPHREVARERWEGYPTRHNTTRKAVRKTVQAWIEENEGLRTGVANWRADPLSKSLGGQIALRNLHHVPFLALAKFLAGFERELFPGFDERYFPEYFLKDIILDGFVPGHDGWRIVPALYGRTFRDTEELVTYVRETYPALPPSWVGNMGARLMADVMAVKLPEVRLGMYRFHGAPLVWALAAVGLVATAARERRLLGFHPLWLLSLSAVAVAMFTAAPIRERYRLMFQPFVVVGLAAFADLVAVALRAAWAGLRSPEEARTPPATGEARAPGS